MSATPRNAPCPCGSGRRFKRCCAGIVDRGTRIVSVHSGVGKRLQAWAFEEFPEAMNAAWHEITTGREDAVLGGGDVQLIATWMFNDRELPGGGSVAARYAQRDDLPVVELDVAGRIAAARLGLFRAVRVAPGCWIELEDLTRRDVVRVISHGVSHQVRPRELLVGRRMDGPPAPSLWGPVGFVRGEVGSALSGLLRARMDMLGLGDRPGDLAVAMNQAAREITMMLAPAHSLRDYRATPPDGTPPIVGDYCSPEMRNSADRQGAGDPQEQAPSRRQRRLPL